MGDHQLPDPMAWGPCPASGDGPRKIRKYCLGTGPAAPDAAVENRKEHDAQEEQEENEQEEIRFTDPDDGAEKIQLERLYIKTEGAFTAYSEERHAKHQYSLQPCSCPASGAEGFCCHAFLLGVPEIDIMGNSADLIRTKLFLKSRHAVRCSVRDYADMVGERIPVDEFRTRQ